jgi:ATP-binding cassette subfamily C protein LapB
MASMAGQEQEQEQEFHHRRTLSLLVTACRGLPLTVLFASVAINVLSLVMPLAVMQVYDRIVPRQSVETLIALTMVVCGVVVVEGLLQVARGHVLRWSATQLAWQAHRDLLGRLLHAPEHLVHRESASRTLDRAQALMTYAEWHGSPSRLVLIDVPFVFFFLGLAALIGGWLVLAPIVLFVALGAVAIRRGTRLRNVTQARATEDMKVRDFLIETLTGLTTIKAGAMEAQMSRRFDRLLESLAACSRRIAKLGEEAQSFAGLLSNLTQMACVTIGAFLVIGGSMSVGTLACCVMLAGRAVQPLLRCFTVWSELQAVVIGLEKARPLLSLPQMPPRSAQERIEGPIGVNLVEVELRHRGGGVVLDEASLDIEAGSIVSIMGADGSGKSTLVDFLSGAIAPERGRLLLANRSFDVDGQALKQVIAVVRPGNSTVRGSILENITMFRTGEHAEIAIEAARLIGLDGDILRLPRGYDTQLGEGVGAEFPPGLIQRIAIARAIARRTGLLIIDEASAALDLGADAALADGLKKLRGHTTIVLVTNRPSLARIADSVLILDKGGLSPCGDRLAQRVSAA